MMTFDEIVHCPRCDSPMWDLGNLENSVLASYPPCWRNTWACHHCKVKIVKIVQETSPKETDFVKDYEEVEEIETPIQKRRREILEEKT